jgi:hypothetical protein
MSTVIRVFSKNTPSQEATELYLLLGLSSRANYTDIQKKNICSRKHHLGLLHVNARTKVKLVKKQDVRISTGIMWLRPNGVFWCVWKSIS